MRKADLIEKLNEKGVPQQSYSVDGMKGGECLCIVEECGIWKVVYNSRGKITNSVECESEEAAYDEIYKQISDAYGW
ncbi:hypothetical protein RND59_00820 [Vibrio ruber]|uniref:hypothetical protein n=1 Tax=Vibrio ruber TaxID=184755 RepID=UPI002892EB4D|nr:hypothetical protein [Vibrio ruber]WNJ95699.1 hypothetical protein RND59_00820 [Vibrio ruber]